MSTTDLSRRAGARILLVEDNELNQEVAGEMLRQANFVVDIASDGQVAIEQLTRAPYDCVLMDMQMPVMDGLTATRVIRKLPQFASLPILAMTANAMASDQQRCFEAGMNDHIAKPISPEDLWAKLQRWIPPRESPATPADGSATADEAEAEVKLTINPIDGLDLVQGLRFALGRETFYRRLLDRFVSSQQDFPFRIRCALAEGDFAAALHCAHTLKGVAAQIGAIQVPAMAAQLESGIRQHEPGSPLQPLQPLIAGIEEKIGALVSAIKLQSAAEEPMLAVPPDPAKIRAVYAQLVTQLAADDYACNTTLKENTPLLRAALGDQYVWIVEAIETTNYSAALDWLKASARKQGIELP